jgi:hypothetical protein
LNPIISDFLLRKNLTFVIVNLEGINKTLLSNKASF